MKIIKKIKRKLQKSSKNKIISDVTPDKKNAQKWFADDGDNTLRLKYPLNSQSVVFDLGGYEGGWASQIFDKYVCDIYVFEPVKSFYDKIKLRFCKNDKVKIFNYGLGAKDEEFTMFLNADGSSAFVDKGVKERCKLKNINAFFNEQKIDKINLMKINIEGGEYQLLEYMIEEDLQRKVKNFQIQFHLNAVDNFKNRLKSIQEEFSKTHELTYQYNFVWENWKLIEK